MIILCKKSNNPMYQDDARKEGGLISLHKGPYNKECVQFQRLSNAIFKITYA